MAPKTEAHDYGTEHVDQKHQTQVSEVIEAEKQLTLREVWKQHPRIVLWSLFWAMAAIGWGFDAQINGAMISVPAFRRDFGYMEGDKAILPANWQTAFNSVSSVGQFFGGFICSYISDRIGRKGGLLIGLLITTGGIFGEMFSTANAAFVVSKLILGFGLGFYLTLAPLTTSEIAPVVLRGISSSGVNLGIAMGQLLSNAIVKAFGERGDRWAYRGPFAIQLFFVLILAIGLPFVPETPWYLARAGKREEAKRSLLKLYGPNVDLEAKLAAVEQTIAEEESANSESPGLVQCFKGTDLIRTMISVGVFMCQHLVGIVFVLGFSTYFFQLAGVSNAQSFNLGVGVSACGVAGNLSSWFVVNSFGRRKIFLTGMGLLTLLLLLIGIMDVIPTKGAQWAQATFTIVYAFVYFATIGAMAFAVLGETSSTALKAPTMALATATQGLLGLVMNIAVPYLVNPDEANLKGKVGFIFGGLGVAGCVWAFLFVPELKGRSYHDIDHMFQTKVPPRRMGSYTY